jgi:hypothetical protein
LNIEGCIRILRARAVSSARLEGRRDQFLLVNGQIAVTTACCNAYSISRRTLESRSLLSEFRSREDHACGIALQTLDRAGNELTGAIDRAGEDRGLVATSQMIASSR